MIASASLLGLRGCAEYLVNALGGVPNWRIFASFFNPNLLAGYSGDERAADAWARC
jgi:hypothetical protein